MPSLEEDDPEAEEQSPIGDIGHYMAAGEAVSYRRLNDMDEMACWAWPSDQDFYQEIEEQVDDRSSLPAQIQTGEAGGVGNALAAREAV